MVNKKNNYCTLDKVETIKSREREDRKTRGLDLAEKARSMFAV